MRTLKVIPLAVVVALVASFPAAAGPRRAGRPSFSDCQDMVASFQVPRSQAQAYLPEGFTATGGAAGQEEVIHLYVDAVACGGEKPTLEMSKTYVAVNPPEELAGVSSAEYYVLDMGASGAAGARLRKYLCLDSFLQDADIEVTRPFEPTDGGPASGSANVSFGTMSASFTIATYGTASSNGGVFRWFFTNEDGEVDYFETIKMIGYLGMGGGELAFSGQYRDLPLAGPALGLYRVSDQTFYPSASCRP